SRDAILVIGSWASAGCRLDGKTTIAEKWWARQDSNLQPRDYECQSPGRSTYTTKTVSARLPITTACSPTFW
ncbi:MAG: hypothetical protein AB7Q04_11590, partial [Steroidobacteraceae bacterium]